MHARLLALLLLTGLCSPLWAAQPLKLTTITWPPYADENLADQGMAVDIVQLALKRAGYDSEVVFETTGRGLEGTSIGIYDVSAVVWKSEPRERDFLFSEPYLLNDIKLIKRAGSPLRFTQISDLRGLLIGVTAGYTYGDEFDNASGFVRIPQNHEIQNLLHLLQGRVDMIVAEKWSLLYQLMEFMPTNADKIEMLWAPVTSKGLRIAVARSNPDHAEIVERFNAAIAEMRADGSLQATFDKHRERILASGLVDDGQLDKLRRW